MATNVKANQLNYDKYETKKYDDEVKRSVPGHKKLHKEVSKFIKNNFKGKKVKVLELGIGTGLTAELLLKEMSKDSDYTAVDFSKNMLNGAKNRLSKYNVNFIEGDFSKLKFTKDNNIVVSVIAIHHQKTDKDKKDLFKKIYNSLKKEGVFIFGDLVTYKNKEKASLNEALHYHHLVKKSKNIESLTEWAYHHKFLNSLAPLESQIEWLKKIGFKEVKIIFQKFNTSLIFAWK